MTQVRKKGILVQITAGKNSKKKKTLFLSIHVYLAMRASIEYGALELTII